VALNANGASPSHAPIGLTTAGPPQVRLAETVDVFIADFSWLRAVFLLAITTVSTMFRVVLGRKLQIAARGGTE